MVISAASSLDDLRRLDNPSSSNTLLHNCTHSLQMHTPVPAISLSTLSCVLPQKEHRSILEPSSFFAIRFLLFSNTCFLPGKNSCGAECPHTNSKYYRFVITLSIRPYSMASWADIKLSRSVSRWMISSGFPVLSANILFRFSLIRKYRSA